MRITKHIYQISGNAFGTNSSTYVADTGDGLLLFDAGYSESQMDVMHRMLAFWGLEKKPVTHCFLTHVHLDHAANAGRLQKAGAKILIGRRDADALENGGAEALEKLFGQTLERCRPDVLLDDGDRFCFGDITVSCIGFPGHTPGSMGFLVEDHKTRCLVAGDFVALGAVSPDESSQEVFLSAMIKPGFQEKEYGESLRKAQELQTDILLTGHMFPYYGNVSKIFETAYRKYLTEEKKIMDLRRDGQ